MRVITEASIKIARDATNQIVGILAADFQRGVDPLDAGWPPLQPVLGTLSTCRYSGSGQHVDFMRFYSRNYRTPTQKSVAFAVDR